MKLILAQDVILAASPVATEFPWGWRTPGGDYARNAGATGMVEAEVPAGFDPARWRWVDGALVALPPPPAPPPPPRVIQKTAIIRRATDEEIAAFLAFMANMATPRQRLLWENAQGNEVLVSDVEPLCIGLFGATRAAELLAPA